MKVLHLYRGYGAGLRNPVIEVQINSIKDKVEVFLYPIGRSGWKGYLLAVPALKKYLKNNKIDLVHAHYSFSGFAATLTMFPRVICSLMGSDILRQNAMTRFITVLFHKLFWKATVVKSAQMLALMKGACLIPNGVEMSKFIPMPQGEAQKSTALDSGSRNVIFVATDISEPVKNFALARDAVARLNDPMVKLVPLSLLEHEKLVYYYNAADLLLLTSLSEGSPNVVKEAMACNCPIVATDVGDVKAVIGNAAECHVTAFDAGEIAKKIGQVLKSGKRSNGREYVRHLDSALIADQLIELYRHVLKIKS